MECFSLSLQQNHYHFIQKTKSLHLGRQSLYILKDNHDSFDIRRKSLSFHSENKIIAFRKTIVILKDNHDSFDIRRKSLNLRRHF